MNGYRSSHGQERDAIAGARSKTGGGGFRRRSVIRPMFPQRMTAAQIARPAKCPDGTDQNFAINPHTGCGILTMAPPVFINRQFFFAATVTGQPQLLPAVFVNAQAFFSPALSTALEPSLHTNVQAFFSPTVTEPSTYTANPVNFDGTNDFLTRGADLTDAPDAAEWTVSVWFRHTRIDSRDWILSNTGPNYLVGFEEVNNTVRIRLRDGTNTILLEWFTQAITDTNWHHLMVSRSDTTALAYLDGAALSTSPDTTASGNIDFTEGEHACGSAANSVNKFQDDMADVLMWAGTFVDLSQLSNRELFIKNDEPADPDDAETAIGAATVRFSGATAEAILIYQDSGTATTSPLVAWLDTDVTGLPVTPSGDDVTITWNASGIFQL